MFFKFYKSHKDKKAVSQPTRTPQLLRTNTPKYPYQNKYLDDAISNASAEAFAHGARKKSRRRRYKKDDGRFDSTTGEDGRSSNAGPLTEGTDSATTTPAKKIQVMETLPVNKENDKGSSGGVLKGVKDDTNASVKERDGEFINTAIFDDQNVDPFSSTSPS